MQHRPDPSQKRPDSTERSHRLRPGRCRARRAAIAAAVAATAFTFVAGADSASAKTTGEAIVECNAAYDTIAVTPQVVSDWPNSDQWTATKVWIARWTGSAWTWTSSDWKIELASKTNTPIAGPIPGLGTQEFTRSNGYYYVYVQSFMWDGTQWYGGTGTYTRIYTQVTPSVSHEPDSRTQASFCSL